MKKLIYFLLLIPSIAIAQQTITGTVLDSETQEPIPNVAIHADKDVRLVLTDKNGKFKLSVNNSKAIHFTHLAYERLSMPSDSLMENPILWLTPQLMEIGEIVVLPDKAYNLLNKAIQNLNSRYLTKETKSYLFHIDKSTSNEDECEAYALIDIVAAIKKNGKCNFSFNLLQLDKVKTEKKKRIPVDVALFPQPATPPSKTHYMFELIENTENEEQITIKVSPRIKNKKHYYYLLYDINSRDTVLTEYTGQSYSDLDDKTAINKTLFIKWKTINHYAQTVYARDKDSGLYYLKQFQHLGSLRILSGVPFDCSFNVTCMQVENHASPTDISEQKSVKPHDYLLFKVDFPQTPGFWKPFYDEPPK